MSNDVLTKANPLQRAYIREAECIGCTKCIQVCPVDAILGSAKQMHSVISDECTGCELCIAPCPVDCIDLHPVTTPIGDKSDQYLKRHHARQNRMLNENKPVLNRIQQKKLIYKAYIQAAIQRAKLKKHI